MSEQLAPIPFVVALAILAWNIFIAGWIASRHEVPRPFAQLTGFCGLLVAPALVVAVATGTDAGSRTVSGIAWLLPVVTCAFVLQVLYAITARLVSVVIGIPILLYDLAIAAVAIGDYLVGLHGSAPLGLQAAVAARDAVIGMTIGRAALLTPLALLVPMIAPAYPARWRLSAVARAVLVLTATVTTTLLVMEWPRGIGAVRSYARALGEPMQARPAGDFLIGMRLFPALDGPPPSRAVVADGAMAERFAPDVILIVLNEEGTRGTSLDSLARVLEPFRSDSVRIVIAMSVASAAAAPTDAAHLAMIERVLVRARPDVLFPAMIDPVPTLLSRATLPPIWWETTLESAARVVRRVRPRTIIGWAASRFDATDSAVYAWSARTASPVGVIGAVSYPSFSGLPAIDARLRTLERWHALATNAAGATQAHWLVNVGGLPHAHGDDGQLAAIRHALAWGSRRAWIGGAIIGEAADYDSWLGLRAASGRLRSGFIPLADAAKAMRDVRVER